PISMPIGAARGDDWPAPGTSTSHTTERGFGALWVARRRVSVVFRLEPILAELPHAARHIEQPEGVGLLAPGRHVVPIRTRDGILRRDVGIIAKVPHRGRAGAAAELPLRFGRQPVAGIGVRNALARI